MTDRRVFISLLLALLAIFPTLAGGAETAGKQRVIFQVSESVPAKWVLTLNNVRNIQAELGKDNVQVEILAYGPGIDMLKFESQVGVGLAQALSDKVVLIACENTMINAKVSKDEMYNGVTFVRAGVAHLMKRQQEGWAYIRP